MTPQYWMPMLSSAFFLVSLLNVVEMTRLTIHYEDFMQEKLEKERDIAIIFLSISIILSVVSYGA